jgi:DNA-binding NtrC family response regulator
MLISHLARSCSTGWLACNGTRITSTYFDGSNTTNRILDVLEEKRPKIICIDELDKMPKQFQEKLLNFMESGHINPQVQVLDIGITVFSARKFDDRLKQIQVGHDVLYYTLEP